MNREILIHINQNVNRLANSVERLVELIEESERTDPPTEFDDES
jgi:hypothetical protein